MGPLLNKQFKSNNSYDLKYTNKTIALAGIFQASALIKQLAWTGKCDQPAFTTSIYSLLKVNSTSVIDIYENLNHLSLGFESLINFFNKSNKKDMEIARYVFSLLYLEKKLTKRADLIKIVRSGINRAHLQSNLFSLTHDNVIANLASIYIDTLSTFTFRIQITGSQIHLTNPNIANKTRALLLAGIRSAVLWKQLEGSRLQLFFKKNDFLNCAQQLYKDLTRQISI